MCRKRAIKRMKAEGLADEQMLRALAEFVTPGRSDVSLTFGESLPKELHLESTADCLSPVSAIATEH